MWAKCVHGKWRLLRNAEVDELQLRHSVLYKVQESQLARTHPKDDMEQAAQAITCIMGISRRGRPRKKWL